jgi:hypothetical protein
MEGNMKLSRILSVVLLTCVVFPAFSTADQLEDAKKALDNKDYKKAYELYAPLAEAKDLEAQTRLGIMYVNGLGVKMDLTKGLGLIMEAANQGYDMAQVCALDVYMDIARTGDTGAMYNVGGMCLKGWGGEQDKTVCLKWLEKAAKLGHTNSAKVLNKIYTKGLYGITSDEEKASYWTDLLAAYDAGLDGTWSGEASGLGGGPPMPTTFTFKTDGNKLTGTTLGSRDRNIQIQKGKIDGKDFSFIVKTTSFGGTKMTTEYTGEFFGDTIKLTYTTETSAPIHRGPGVTRGGASESPPMTFIAKRSEI